MKNHHEVGHFKNRMMIGLLSLSIFIVFAGQSFAATTCSSCHGMPPLDSADGSRIPSTGAFKGSHQVHVSGSPTPATSCNPCHSGAPGYSNSHSATTGQNVINLTTGIYSKGNFFNQTSMPASPLGTCSNVSCHADVYSVATIESPVWGTTAGCSACHSTLIGINGPETGNHTNVNDHKVACVICHEADTTATTKPSVQHADGNIDVANVGYATLNKTKGSSGTTCSVASCHTNVYGTGSATTPAWGTTGNGCAACHTTAIAATGPATGSHAVHATADCSKCHATASNNTTKPTANHADGDIDVTGGYPVTVKHAAGDYAADAKCSTASCHADVYSALTVLSPKWGTTGNGCAACHTTAIAATGPATGSHAVHATADCSKCHATASNNTTKPTANHADGDIDVTGGYPVTAKHAAGDYAADAKCSTASCHADVYSVSTVLSPKWGTTGNGCAACHTTVIAATGPATGSHAVHATTDCSKCHDGATNNTTKPTANHINGNIDVNSGYPADVAKHTTASGFNGRTCSTATCHANVYGTGNVASPAWGTAAGCEACHTVTIGANGPATGKHAAHAGIECTKCHAVGTTSTTAPTNGNGHIDGNIDIYGVGYTPDLQKHSATTYTATCSAAYCHSNGLVTGYTSTSWGGSNTVGCRFCHPTLSDGHNTHLGNLFDAGTPVSFYAYTSTKSVGGDYKFGCANCHPLTVANHLNNSIEVVLTASASGGSLKKLNGLGAAINVAKQCANVYCHSNGYSANLQFATTPVWGTGSFPGDKCAGCHGNSPSTDGSIGSSAHKAHVVGIHYEDTFNGVSKKLPIGGGNNVNAAHGRNNRSTTINCNVCHAATITSSANDKNFYCKGCHDGTTPVGLVQGSASIASAAKHVNGSVDVVFIDQKIATKAQVAQTAFAAYTAVASGSWTRNNGIYKTYTSGYDVTKALLSASPTYSVDGCAVACHSNNMSAKVKWTDTVKCTSCHTRLK